jgi:LPS-assembly lipoprotein
MRFSGSEARQGKDIEHSFRFYRNVKCSGSALRIAALLLALAVPVTLSACSSLRPVYGDNGLTSEAIELAYARPANRLEQVIYQSLALRLGKAGGTDAPLVAIVATQSSRALTKGTATSPNTQRQMTVTATVTLKAVDGTVLFTGTRSASADYTTDPQALANQAAETEAAERAARALAETIRLTLIAALASPAQ